MKTGGSAQRLIEAGKNLFDAATYLASHRGVAVEPVGWIETALRNVADVLRRSERLDRRRSMQVRLEAGLLLLGLDECTSCREDIVQALLDHNICTEEALTPPCDACTDEPCIDHVRL